MANIVIPFGFRTGWTRFFRIILAGQFFGVETFSELTFAQQNFIFFLQGLTAFIMGYIVLWAVKKAVSIFIWG